MFIIRWILFLQLSFSISSVFSWNFHKSVHYELGWASQPVFSCPSYTRSQLVTSKENNEKATKLLASYLTSHQSNCNLANLDLLHDYGIGSAIVQGAVHFAIALRSNKVYRPEKDVWLWAEKPPSSCTLEIPSLDCYFDPISSCRKASYTATNDSLMLAQRIDVCWISHHFQKPLIWVFGRLVDYIIRPTAQLQSYIVERIKELHQNSTKTTNSSQLLSIGIHIRGGSPDADRKTISVPHYMAAMDEMASRLQQTHQRQVDFVYICSDDIPNTVKSAYHLSITYPRPWTYVILPHITLSTQPGNEQETLLRKIPQASAIPRRQLVEEYMADIEILASATGFIGCHSNVYAMVASLRMSRTRSISWSLNQTCLIDHRESDLRMHCEGSPVSRAFWSSDFIDLGFSSDPDPLHYWLS